MSGVTLAVGPRTEPDRTATTASSPTAKQQDQSRHPSRQPVVAGGVMGSLRVIELQLVAFIMVFSASGLVSLLDLAYPALVTLYLLALSRLAFPSACPVCTAAPAREVFVEGGLFFRLYVAVGTLAGLFLPLAYVLGGFARGDDHAVRSATPHLFLLSCQILTENVVSSFGAFSPPVRALVPLLYTVRRVFVIIDWAYDVSFNKRLPATAPLKDVAWLWFGRGLALANLIYFSVNLFGFLIPRFLPRAFERYFMEKSGARAKTAEDDRAPHAAADQTETKPREGKKTD